MRYCSQKEETEVLAEDRVGAGLVTGPSHTTGHAVFRIRRLNPAGLLLRKV